MVMAKQLAVSIELDPISGTEFKARVITWVPDNGYEKGEIKRGLPPNEMGMPEYDYVTAHLTRTEGHHAPVDYPIEQNLQGSVSASQGKLGVYAYVLVDGIQVGSAYRPYPRTGENTGSLPIQLDLDDALDSEARGFTATGAGPSCHDFDLLTIKGWKEVKFGKEEKCWNVLGRRVCSDVPVSYTRTCEFHVVAEVCHPELSTILSDVESCLTQAAAVGVIVGLVTKSAQAGGAALTAYLKECLTRKGIKRASEISAKVDPRSERCSGWHKV
jgi:hypothetical protein